MMESGAGRVGSWRCRRSGRISMRSSSAIFLDWVFRLIRFSLLWAGVVRQVISEPSAFFLGFA